MWGEINDISLAAIKPLMESRHWGGMSRVKRISLLRVTGGSTMAAPLPYPARLSVWKQGICSLMKLSAFAQASDIEDLDAFDLQTYLQSKKESL